MSVPDAEPVTKSPGPLSADAAMDHLAEYWRVFSIHHPIGLSWVGRHAAAETYVVEVQDGQCGECFQTWPCATARSLLKSVWSAGDLHGWDRGTELVQQRTLDALNAIEANDSVQRGAYGQASRDAVDLVARRVLGKRWPRRG